MRIHVRRPSTLALRQLADEQREFAVTYEPVGMTALGVAPDGYRRKSWTRTIGTGAADFAVASASLRTWGLQTGSGLVVAADGDVAPGVVVALAAPLPVGWIDVVCRVIEVVDEPTHFSFTYGTLPEHPEQGEERFGVELTESGSVDVEIVAVSKSRNPLARLAPPIANFLQERATQRYLDAIEHAVIAAR